jgi:hypothetical protein
MRYIIFSLLVTTLFYNKKEAKVKQTKVSFEVIYKNQYNGLSEKFNQLITNEEDYKVFMKSIDNDKISVVDFSLYSVVVLNMGEKTSSGFDIEPRKIIEDKNGQLKLIVKETYPQRNQKVANVMTTPICIVKVQSKKDIIIK